MKPGDVFHKMHPQERLRKVAARKYHLQEVYSSPDEIISDLMIVFSELDSLAVSRDQLALDYRRLYGGRVEIMNEISDVFKRFEFLYKDPPDLPIPYKGK